MKRILAITFLVVLLCGCVHSNHVEDISSFVPTEEIDAPVTESVTQEPKPSPADFVTFSRSTEPREVEVPVSEILEYESQYPDCNGTWFRSFLTGEDLVIYNSYLYALENRFIYFHVYVKDSDKDFSDIREMVALDSPFLEQNYSRYEYITKRPINYAGESILVSMEQFTDSRWEMKLEALSKCREIVANMPEEYQSQQEKMEYLYRYVCDHVEYVEYERMVDESYFYDAVCKGKTNCDGYSNMLSLLFRLIGIECCEVTGFSADQAMGHTWVVAKMNGMFYNFDPTFEDTMDVSIDPFTYFGFSDKLVDIDWTSFALKRPRGISTTRDFHYVDLFVDTITEKDDIKQITAKIEENLDAGIKTCVLYVPGDVDSSQIEKLHSSYSNYRTKYWMIKESIYWDMGEYTIIKCVIVK